jgi:hypothetical protein
MLISVCGFIGSGKDTVAEYLVNQHSFKKESFANPLKDVLAAEFGWDRALLEGNTPQSRAWRETVDPWWADRLNVANISPRYMMQYLGTEIFRNQFHNDIWTVSLAKRIEQSQGKLVISDSRFPNEIAMLKQQGFKFLRIKKGPDPDWFDTATQASAGCAIAASNLEELGIHSSEWSWLNTKFDYVIENNGTLSQLYEKINFFLKNQ